MSKLPTVEVKTTPANITFNFDEVKQQLQEYVADYNVVVTNDNVAESKKAAAELNKLKKSINDKLVEHAQNLEQPGKQLREYSKELGEICTSSREKIMEQVNKFENERKQIARDLLDELLAVLISEYKVSPEFQTAEYDDLVKLTSLTAKGSLSKQAKDELENRVAKDATAEQKVKLRHSELENKSYRAGLSSPLTSEYVAPFIDAPDEEYEQKLQAILDREVEREKQAKEKHEQQLREQHEQEKAEQQRKHEQELNEVSQKTSKGVFNDDQKQRAEKALKIKSVEDGKKIVSVQVTFAVKVSQDIDNNRVAEHVKAKLESAGFEPDEVTCA